MLHNHLRNFTSHVPAVHLRRQGRGDGQELQRGADGGSGRRGADAGRNFGRVVLLQPDQRRCSGRSDPVHDAGRTGNG